MRLRQFRITGSFLGLVLTGFFFAALFLAFAIPAQADNARPDRAVPGTLNYVEGKVAIDAQNVDSSAIGTAQVRMGERLTTRTGKAEVLLTPGVFLRVGDNSSVKMIATSITNTEVALDRGHAMIEVAEIHPENDIRVEADGETAQLLKTGLYDFDANQQELRVFDGKARVQERERFVTVKGGREVSLLSGQEAKPEKFDKRSYSSEDLYRWSSLRSAYVAEANVDAAGYYMANGLGPWGPGWWGAGWYWDPWFDGFAFIPGDGIFYSPFGWGFYSPSVVNESPIYVYGGYRYGAPRVYRHFSANYRSWGAGSHYVTSSRYVGGVYSGRGSVGAFHSGARSGGSVNGFAGGARGFGGVRGGGFNGGGFHGGGFHGGGGVRGH